MPPTIFTHTNNPETLELDLEKVDLFSKKAPEQIWNFKINFSSLTWGFWINWSPRDLWYSWRRRAENFSIGSIGESSRELLVPELWQKPCWGIMFSWFWTCACTFEHMNICMNICNICMLAWVSLCSKSTYTCYNQGSTITAITTITFLPFYSRVGKSENPTLTCCVLRAGS